MPRPENRVHPDSAASGKPVALVAEDQRIVRTMIAMVLKDRFDVVLAETGLKALHLARELGPSLVITDGLMPGLDGRELARMIKGDPSTAHAKVILVTGLYKSVVHTNEAIMVFNIDAVLPKPVSAKTLMREVDRLLGPAGAGEASAHAPEAVASRA